MDYQHQVFTLIKRLTGQENILAVPKDIVRFAGDPATGIFLSQLIYWSDRGTRKDGYIYKTYKEWEEELGITKYYARKAKNNLEEMGIIETKVKKANGNPTVHYKLNQEEFVNQFIKFIEDSLNDSNVQITHKENKNNTEGKCNKHISLTETTTETTNRETNVPTKSECVCDLFEAGNKINCSMPTFELLQYYVNRREELGYETKFKLSNWQEYADKFNQQHYYQIQHNDFAQEYEFEITEELIDAYFSRSFSKSCDYNIPHFLQRDVLINTYLRIR